MHFEDHDQHSVSPYNSNEDNFKLQRFRFFQGRHQTSADIALGRELSENLGAIGPWHGRCDWNPSSGLVGVKQVVDHYSLTRFSTGEWNQRNNDLAAENQRIVKQSIK